MAEHRVVRIGDHDLEVAEAGVGGRPLLLVHGFTGAKEDFGDWFDAFADEGWWVLAPDLRGHGNSAKPELEEHYSVATFADDLIALTLDAGWDRFALLGHSMGGMIAQELALREPARITRLVLMDTCHGPVEGLDPDTVAMGMAILREQGLDVLLELLDALPSQRTPAEERVRATRAGYAEWADSKVRSVSPGMYAAMASELVARADRIDELAGLDVPTLVVVGDQDANFIGPSRRMADAIPGATLAVIPDAAHSPQFEHPEAWWAAVAPFLAG